jgi:hypothetical protein
LAVAVLVSALAFGTLRSIVREPDDLAVLVLISISVGVSFALIRACRKLAGWVTTGLKDRGVRMGGVVGFGVWLLGIGLEVGLFLASIVIGPIATIFLMLWLARLAGL